MKISGAPAEGFSAIRRRNLLVAGASARASPAAVDETGFLGLGESELTPAVRAAIATLVVELEELRREVSQLKARLVDAEAEADQDALTPVKNRRAFLRELHRIAAFSARYGGAASLVYFDLDGLKSVNDRFGHAAGDEALKAVAERLRANVRESDVVGRMGGDEFAVILVQADEEVARTKAAALAKVIESAPVQSGDWMAPLHVSYGVRQIDASLDPETLVSQADAAMYGMKRARAAP
ncbi:MAG: GGDEF domain-containing protein [Caulobacterales bacterium]